VNLHGQHESQALLSEDAQRDVLDALAGATAGVKDVATTHAELEAIRSMIADLTRRRDEALKRADYLRHMAREIADAGLVVGEDERLDDEARRLTHAVELRTHIAQALAALEGDEGAMDALGAARRAVQSSVRLDPAASPMSDAIDQAMVTLQELARDLTAYEASLDSDPERLAEVDRRRDQLSRVTRKHGGSIETALAALRDAQSELEVLDTAAVDLKGLTARETATRESLKEKAARLTRLRQKASRKLATQVEAQLPELGLPGGRFAVHLEPTEEITASGAERVEFKVALNVGHDARPLARTASGGELSRVMLALKTILARLDQVPTLVFDEVDAGIGGTVALKVGDSLRRLAEHHQVLVITHLAQVAARAHHHVVVAKGAKGGVSTADISVVQRDDRVTEVARMLGGDPSSKVSRAHARELLEAAG
jgi:DNA repair protein RecN (Recombination protein N)